VQWNNCQPYEVSWEDFEHFQSVFPWQRILCISPPYAWCIISRAPPKSFHARPPSPPMHRYSHTPFC
jgi:hypothetical protein